MKHKHDCNKAQCKVRSLDDPFFKKMDGLASEKARERMAATKKWHEEHGIEHVRSGCR